MTRGYLVWREEQYIEPYPDTRYGQHIVHRNVQQNWHREQDCPALKQAQELRSTHV